MRLTTKRGKRPAKVELFEVDKRRMGEVTEIFNTVAVTTVGEQATLAKVASEAITAALAAIDRAGQPPKAMEAGRAREACRSTRSGRRIIVARA